MSNITEKANFEFSNPRLRAEFGDWPLGGSRRGVCLFEIEHHAKRGYRAVRTTENAKSGGLNKPKCNTYNGPCAIVDGNDGRTYILQRTHSFIYIWRSDFLTEGTLWPKDPFYTKAEALIEEANR